MFETLILISNLETRCYQIGLFQTFFKHCTTELWHILKICEENPKKDNSLFPKVIRNIPAPHESYSSVCVQYVLVVEYVQLLL